MHPDIDTTRAGFLELPPGLIGQFLALPEGQQAVGARINDKGHVELLIIGRGMPPHEPNTAPAPVALTQDNQASGEKILSWVHDPSIRWRRPR